MTVDKVRQQNVLSLLQNLQGIEPLKKLMWQELGYTRKQEPLSRREIAETARAALAEDPMLFATAGQNDGFQVIYSKLGSDTLRLGDERPVVSSLLKNHPYSLFVFSNRTQDRWHFLNVKYDDSPDRRRLFRRITVGPEEQLRTASERLSILAPESISPDLFGLSPLMVQNRHDEAFDVEPVTDEFFGKYREVFEYVEGEVKGIKSPERRRLFTQKLFNRLMFVAFVQKKGWLRLDGSTDYLSALWRDYTTHRGSTGSFYESRLRLLFFQGLNDPRELDVGGANRNRPDGSLLQLLIGDVPYLNGGLFEEDDDDRNESITVPDDCFPRILKELFDSFNFTVTESTPLDVEVAVDPEMLGRVFEELVTGRHETGSYYTPRPVVAFMCREALKGFLGTSVPSESREALARFVEEHDPAGLHDSESVLGALRRVTVVDPACGSGAYLLGMLHELFALRQCLFQAKSLDPKTAYERKLEIIQHNLYGVDLDQFAVNVARLRLWLSLAVDHEGKKPEPLPNLDFKIEQGDSLTARNPEAAGQMAVQDKLVLDFQTAKDDYLMAHGQQKLALRQEALALKEQVALWTRSKHAPLGFDWPVEFAEVFRQGGPHTTLDGKLPLGNELKGQMDLAGGGLAGGFDVVLANPPYVRADPQFKHVDDEKLRQEEIAKYKVYRAKLHESGVYQTLYEKWDLYIPFLERAHQLLRQGGQMAFIIPDAYNAAKYANRSHEFFLAKSRVQRIDFCTEIPLFKAGVFNTILHFAKAVPPSTHEPLRVRRWGKKADEFEHNREVLLTGLQSEVGAALFKLNARKVSSCRVDFVPLGHICYISYGLAASSDEKNFKGEFVTSDVLSDVRDKKHPKPYMEGKDIVRWHVVRERYLEWGTPRAPARFRRQTFPELHEAEEKLVALVVAVGLPPIAYDSGRRFTTHTSCIFVPWQSLQGVRNRSLRKTAKYRDEVKRAERPPGTFREQLEESSRRFSLKFMLAIMNSASTEEWLADKRRSKHHIYPDDWKDLPIPDVPVEQQRPLVRLVDSVLAEFSRRGHPLPSASALRVAGLEREIDDRVKVLYGQ